MTLSTAYNHFHLLLLPTRLTLAVLMGRRHMDGQVLEEVFQHFGRDVSGAREKYRQCIADG